MKEAKTHTMKSILYPLVNENKAALLSAMRASSIERARVHFDARDDEVSADVYGQMTGAGEPSQEHPLLITLGGIELKKLTTTYNGHGVSHETSTHKASLQDGLKELCEQIAMSEGYFDFAHGAGGHGQMTLDARTGIIHFDYERNVERERCTA